MPLFSGWFGQSDEEYIVSRDSIRDKLKERLEEDVKKAHEHIDSNAAKMENELISNGSYSDYLSGKCDFDDLSYSDQEYISRLYADCDED